METKAFGLMLYRMDMLTSNQGQRANSRWTRSLKNASSVTERREEGIIEKAKLEVVPILQVKR